MSILGVNSALAGACQYTNKTQKTVTSGADFAERTAQAQESLDAEKLENFKKKSGMRSIPCRGERIHPYR